MQKVRNYVNQRSQKKLVFLSPYLFHSLLIFFTSSLRHLLMLRLAPTQRPVWNFVGHRLEGKHPSALLPPVPFYYYMHVCVCYIELQYVTYATGYINLSYYLVYSL